MYLKLECIDSSTKKFYDTLKNYQDDAGFDLYCTKREVVPAKALSHKIFLGVKASLHNISPVFVESVSKPFMLVPRSSMGSKTPLRLSNSIGIVDAGYRGELIAVVDNMSDNDFVIERGDRLIQIVPFGGESVKQVLLDCVDTFSKRGVNGFGSTGR